MKEFYPDLWDALRRIKTYRNNDLHLELTASADRDLVNYLERDLEGKRVQQLAEGWFLLQQIVLDELMVAVQCELNRYS